MLTKGFSLVSRMYKDLTIELNWRASLLRLVQFTNTFSDPPPLAWGNTFIIKL